MAVDDNRPSPWLEILDRRGVVVLDGGLATELEAAGHDLRSALWSARLLIDDPAAIARVHGEALTAGADGVTTATYQASLPGFRALGLADADAVALLERAVDLAEAACAGQATGGRRPFVAASIGPYGAALADGSEYRGDDRRTRRELVDFHRWRWEVLAGRCRLLACETLPSLREARALLELLDATPGVSAWFSFSCRDESRISDGTPIVRCAELLAGHERVVAIGVNCVPPRRVLPLIAEVRRGAPRTDVIVYPNSGERWDATARRWVGDRAVDDFAALAREWRAAGASWIGGCCRTAPAHTRAIAAALRSER